MSDRPIQVGDLVVVVKWPCCGKFLGHVFQVRTVWGNYNTGRCSLCGSFVGELWSVGDGRFAAWPTAWLKRIPPLSELEGQRSEETRYIPRTPQELAYYIDNELTEDL